MFDPQVLFNRIEFMLPRGTPALDVDGRVIRGGVPYDQVGCAIAEDRGFVAVTSSSGVLRVRVDDLLPLSHVHIADYATSQQAVANSARAISVACRRARRVVTARAASPTTDPLVAPPDPSAGLLERAAFGTLGQRLFVAALPTLVWLSIMTAVYLLFR